MSSKEVPYGVVIDGKFVPWDIWHGGTVGDYVRLARRGVGAASPPLGQGLQTIIDVLSLLGAQGGPEASTQEDARQVGGVNRAGLVLRDYLAPQLEGVASYNPVLAGILAANNMMMSNYHPERQGYEPLSGTWRSGDDPNAVRASAPKVSPTAAPVPVMPSAAMTAPATVSPSAPSPMRADDWAMEQSPLAHVLGGLVDAHHAGSTRVAAPGQSAAAPPSPFSNLAGPRIAPDMVTLASGRRVPAGAQGTSQDGRYQYVVQPDGSVLNVTTGRIAAPAR